MKKQIHRTLQSALLLFTIICTIHAQNLWDGATYPDEYGLRQRMTHMLQRIAAKEYGTKSMAYSKYSDVGLPKKQMNWMHRLNWKLTAEGGCGLKNKFTFRNTT